MFYPTEGSLKDLLDCLKSKLLNNNRMHLERNVESVPPHRDFHRNGAESTFEEQKLDM